MPDLSPTPRRRPYRIGQRLLLLLLVVMFMNWDHQVPARRLLMPPGPVYTAELDPASVRKICQVVGEHDRHAGQATVNRTETQARFWGTDLGASFEHQGKLFVLFGDTHPTDGLARPPDSDTIAVSDDRDGDGCLRLTFHRNGDGGFRPLQIPGIYSGAFAVPTGGFSLDGRMYVLATSDVPGRGPMGRSVLARSDDDGWTFRYLHDLSRDKLIQVSPAVVRGGSISGLPDHAGEGVLLWGSGLHRRSPPYLAYVPGAAVEDRGALLHYAGTDADSGEVRWSRDEAASKPLFDQACVGEFSVAWNPYLQKWMMLYTCGGPQSSILLRTADKPWGPWTEAEMVFDPAGEVAECGFLHPPSRPGPMLAGGQPCPVLSDPHTPETLGDAYGPYLISRFTRPEPDGASTIYFLMSTWNPYTVVLMQATIRLREEGVLKHQVSHSAGPNATNR